MESETIIIRTILICFTVVVLIVSLANTTPGSFFYDLFLKH